MVLGWEDHVLILTDGDGKRLVRPFPVISPIRRGP
jgi:hypothetical protein